MLSEIYRRTHCAQNAFQTPLTFTCSFLETPSYCFWRAVFSSSEHHATHINHRANDTKTPNVPTKLSNLRRLALGLNEHLLHRVIRFFAGLLE
jgi:hypothetical protein